MLPGRPNLPGPDANNKLLSRKFMLKNGFGVFGLHQHPLREPAAPLVKTRQRLVRTPVLRALPVSQNSVLGLASDSLNFLIIRKPVGVPNGMVPVPAPNAVVAVDEPITRTLSLTAAALSHLDPNRAGNALPHRNRLRLLRLLVHFLKASSSQQGLRPTSDDASKHVLRVFGLCYSAQPFDLVPYRLDLSFKTRTDKPEGSGGGSGVDSVGSGVGAGVGSDGGGVGNGAGSVGSGGGGVGGGVGMGGGGGGGGGGIGVVGGVGGVGGLGLTWMFQPILSRLNSLSRPIIVRKFLGKNRQHEFGSLNRQPNEPGLGLDRKLMMEKSLRVFGLYYSAQLFDLVPYRLDLSVKTRTHKPARGVGGGEGGGGGGGVGSFGGPDLTWMFQQILSRLNSLSRPIIVRKFLGKNRQHEFGSLNRQANELGLELDRKLMTEKSLRVFGLCYSAQLFDLVPYRLDLSVKTRTHKPARGVGGGEGGGGGVGGGGGGEIGGGGVVVGGGVGGVGGGVGGGGDGAGGGDVRGFGGGMGSGAGGSDVDLTWMFQPILSRLNSLSRPIIVRKFLSKNRQHEFGSLNRQPNEPGLGLDRKLMMEKSLRVFSLCYSAQLFDLVPYRLDLSVKTRTHKPARGVGGGEGGGEGGGVGSGLDSVGGGDGVVDGGGSVGSGGSSVGGGMGGVGGGGGGEGHIGGGAGGGGGGVSSFGGPDLTWMFQQILSRLNSLSRPIIVRKFLGKNRQHEFGSLNRQANELGLELDRKLMTEKSLRVFGLCYSAQLFDLVLYRPDLSFKTRTDKPDVGVGGVGR